MTIQEQIHALPEPVRAWFGSTEVTDLIDAIEEKFAIDPETDSISGLLLLVILKELPLEDLADELAFELELTPARASEIYQEIKVRVLVPVASHLLRMGIGTDELAFAARAAQHVPVGPELPSWSPVLHQGSAPTPRMPSAPIAPGSAASPAPVPLYQDSLSSQAGVAKQSWSVGSPVGGGDLARASRTASVVPRPARIDLGVARPSADTKASSFFSERVTPAPQEVDYGASAPAPAVMPSDAAPVRLQDAAPFPQSDSLPYVAPPAQTARIPSADEGSPASGGIFDALMKRVAPWHAARFGGSGRASAALEAPIPSRSVNYAQEQAPVTPSDAAPTSVPTPLDDLPAPPGA